MKEEEGTPLEDDVGRGEGGLSEEKGRKRERERERSMNGRRKCLMGGWL